MTLPRRLLPVRLKSDPPPTPSAARVRVHPDSTAHPIELVEARFAAERTQRFADLESLIHAREDARSAVLWDVPDDDIRRRTQESDRAGRRAEQVEAMANLAESRRAVAPRPPASTPRRSLGWRPSLAVLSPRRSRAVDPGP